MKKAPVSGASYSLLTLGCAALAHSIVLAKCLVKCSLMSGMPAPFFIKGSFWMKTGPEEQRNSAVIRHETQHQGFLDRYLKRSSGAKPLLRSVVSLIK